MAVQSAEEEDISMAYFSERASNASKATQIKVDTKTKTCILEHEHGVNARAAHVIQGTNIIKDSEARKKNSEQEEQRRAAIEDVCEGISNIFNLYKYRDFHVFISNG